MPWVRRDPPRAGIDRGRMSRVQTLYRWLAKRSDLETDQIFAAALEHAEPEYAARIAGILLGRRRESAWSGLVANYDRLPEHVQEHLQEPSELVWAAIASAIKSPSQSARRNALATLEHCPCPQLSYLVADALRDPAMETRAAAVRVLRRQAEWVLDGGDDADQAGSEEVAAGRVKLVRALGEALRRFEGRGDGEVLEVCLWFASDLGAELWAALADSHALCGNVVEQRLRAWDSPRLAGFLLLALGRPDWRRPALALLRSWKTRTAMIALLRNSDLLADPHVRRGLLHLQQPRWFVADVSVIAQLPPDVQAQLPYWTCNLGFSETEQLHYLESWQETGLPELHRSAVYALATMGTRAADKVLAHVASRACPMSKFAKWFLLGKRAAAEWKGRSPRRQRHAAPHRSTLEVELGGGR